MGQSANVLRRCLFGPVLGLTILAAAPAFAEQVTVAEYDRVLAEVTADADPARAIAKAYMLPRMRSYVPSEHMRDALTGALTKIKAPQVRVVLERQLEDVRHQLDDWSTGPQGLKGPLGQHGCLLDFDVLGPFENDSNEAYFSRLPPEVGETGPYSGKMGDMDWRELPAFSRACVLNVDVAITQDSDSVVFLANTIEVSKKTRAKLLLGVSGSYKAWLDGKPIARRDDDAGLSFDADAWTVDLAPGKNQLVIKLASSQGSGLDVVARLLADDLTPLAPAKVTGGWSGTPLAELPETLEPAREGMLERAKALAKADVSASALWGAWLWSAVEYRNAATPWRDIAEAIDRVVADGSLLLAADEHLLLAELFEEHWKRLEILERARAAHPDDPWIVNRLAREYEDSLTERRQIQRKALLEELVKKHPDFAPGVTQLAQWWKQNGYERRAHKLLVEHMNADRAKMPGYTLELVGALESLGRQREARELRESLFPTNAVSANKTWYKVDLAIRSGRLDDALALVRQHRERYPWSTHWVLKEVDVLQASSRFDEAMALLDERLTLVPQSVSVLQRKADLLVAQGDTAAAARVLDEAISIKPQDQELREYVAYLRPEANRFHERWVRGDLRELADATAAGPFHSSTLVDQVIVNVAQNGLAQRVAQIVERANDTEGIDAASILRIPYQVGDERVDVLSVKVYKADGSISEDYDIWNSENSRKASTTYNDNATITLRANNVEPGDVVEFLYRSSQVANRNFRGDYFGDIEYIQGTQPIAFARYAVLYPESWGELYFRAPANTHTRTDGQLPDGSAPEDGVKVTSFDLSNVPYVKTDQNQPGYTDVYDYILVSNKKTYDEIGAWWWNLVKEQLIVDDNIRKTVKELTTGLETDEQKVQAIHNYVVQNTRYLHVGLGIHGWKPYRTTTCFRNRYGDCKDKAALLKVMLEEAGVPANLVLVRTRRLGKVDDEPASMHIFNHAIAYVPGMDLYLDGTAEYNGTRELTTMDQGAQALVVMDGGKTAWVELPIDKPEVNQVVREMSVDLTGDVPVTTLTIVATGANAVYYRSAFEDPERRDELLEKQLASSYPGAQLISASYSDLKKLEQPVEITVKFEGGQLARETDGQRFVYPLGAPKDLLGAYAQQAKRDQALDIRVPFLNKTTIRYKLPTSIKNGKLPPARQLSTKFGSMNIEYSDAGGQLVAQVSYSLDVQRVSAEDYQEFRTFMSRATNALNETIELE